MEAALVTINIKAVQSQPFTVSVPQTAKVEEVKQAISSQNGTEVSRIKLVFKGRILKDSDVLSVLQLKEGDTLHMVRLI